MIATAALLAVLALDAPAARPLPSPRPRVEAPEPPDLPAYEETDAPTDPPILIPFAPGGWSVDPEPIPSPSPSPPPPSLLTRENARPLRIDTQVGMLATMTGEDGTAVTPTFWVNVDGPLALGSKRSVGRLGARLGLSSAPGETINAADVQTYRAVEAALWLGRVIGKLGEVTTTAIVEGSFATRLKGAADPPPLDRLVRSAGIGLRFDASRTNAHLVTLVAYDEASASCAQTINCTGFGSGRALILRGQVPIVSGAVLFGGDVTLSVGQRVAWVQRRDIFRVSIVVDPVAAVRVLRPR